VPLGIIWDYGYVPFVNIETKKSLSDINRGVMDNQIRSMARAFRKWHEEGIRKGQNRVALVAPLQEMNGYWVSYHGTPAEFKDAFSRIQRLFNEEGANSSVVWVFAPNGWSSPNDPPFEDYYPGDKAVSVVAFSSYNAGYCPSASWKSWDSPEKVYASYIERFVKMSPNKPIIIAQTGTTAYSSRGYDPNAKNQWLRDAYYYLAGQTNVIGVIYFNKGINQSCDWLFYGGSTRFEGYKQGVSRDEYIYVPPSDLSELGILP
jgi:beta-mannanase